MKKNGFSLLAVLLAALTLGCEKRHWVPNAAQLKLAESVAKLHVLQYLSDQAGTPEVMGLTFSPEGPPVEYPVLFTLRYTPYSRYRLKFWGDRVRGVQRIHVLYFNPIRIPDWESEKVMDGEFPDHFSVVVDMQALRVVESRPATRPPDP